MAPFDEYDPKLKKWDLATLPFLPTKYVMQVRDGVGKQYNNVKRVFKEANQIIIATDPDREGENIAYLIVDQTGDRDKVTKRLWVNSLLPKAVQDGFRNLRDAGETYNYYKESHSRQISDWLVGMNMTRYYTLRAQEAGIQGTVYSAGRVQTPVMVLIVKNKLERDHFVPVPFWTIAGETEKDGQKVVFRNATHFESEAQLQEFVRTNQLVTPYMATINNVQKEHKIKQSPKLLNLAALTSLANAKWGYTGDEVLQTVQSLYDADYVTYPRTEEEVISEGEFGILAKDVDIYKEYLGSGVATPQLTPRKRYVGDYQAHPALMPTGKLPEQAKLADRDANIYQAIVTQVLMMFAPDYEYDQTTVTITIADQQFIARGKVVAEAGWRALAGQAEEDAAEDAAALPAFAEGERVALTIKTAKGETKPPKPYTPGTLGGKGSVMERLNLGTAATRAAIVKTLVDREYIKLVKKAYEPTDKAMAMYAMVKDSLLGSPEMTAKWEDYLAKIEHGDGDPETFIANVRKFVSQEIGKAQAIELPPEVVKKAAEQSAYGQCPKCHEGTIIKGKANYYCTNQSCDFVLWPKVASKTLPNTAIRALLAGKTTAEISGFKSKAGKSFKAKLQLDGNFNTTFVFGKSSKRKG
jgi:DNA topoisomerase-3